MIKHILRHGELAELFAEDIDRERYSKERDRDRQRYTYIEQAVKDVSTNL